MRGDQLRLSCDRSLAVVRLRGFCFSSLVRFATVWGGGARVERGGKGVMGELLPGEREGGGFMSLKQVVCVLRVRLFPRKSKEV